MEGLRGFTSLTDGDSAGPSVGKIKVALREAEEREHTLSRLGALLQAQTGAAAGRATSVNGKQSHLLNGKQSHLSSGGPAGSNGAATRGGSAGGTQSTARRGGSAGGGSGGSCGSSSSPYSAGSGEGDGDGDGRATVTSAAQQLAAIITSAQPFIQLWEGAAAWRRGHAIRLSTPLPHCNAGATEAETRRISDSLGAAIAAFERAGCEECAAPARALKGEVDAFLPRCRVVHALCSPALRPRHWEELAGALRAPVLAGGVGGAGGQPPSLERDIYGGGGGGGDARRRRAAPPNSNT